jgi:pyruvate/2-oxoglutarate dehydrogenase complex dihydrolipoamide dehydrogenase (E3) component
MITNNKVTKADICIIGGGSGGLSVAAGTAQLGLKTILVERADMGGDCLNTGCVPSKALLAAAKRAQAHRKGDIKGITAHEPEIDFAAVKSHVLDTIQAIAPHDSQERFEQLGVQVIRAEGSFGSPDTLTAGEHTIKARYFVVAAGSGPAVPPIPGLDKEQILTNETIFDLREQPEHLLIIGGGPIGIEMAQAHRHLGCAVSVFDMGKILPRDDQANVEIIRHSLTGEKIDLYEGILVKGVKHTNSKVVLTIEKDGLIENITGSHLLVAAGRKPNTDGLCLEKAGIDYNNGGIIADDRLRTSNRKVFAIGDIAGGPQFTHIAGYHAGIVIRQVCFGMFWTKVNYRALPWVTYCDPELAQVGLTEAEARKAYDDNITVVEQSFNENDSAIAEKTTKGQIRVVTDKNGRILGASIVGPQAGELIGIWGLAISSGLKIRAIADMIIPYPTLGEISKRTAGSWYIPTLFGPKTKRIVRWLQKLPL